MLLRVYNKKSRKTQMSKIPFPTKGPWLWILLTALSAAIKATVDYIVANYTDVPGEFLGNPTEDEDVDDE